MRYFWLFQNIVIFPQVKLYVPWKMCKLARCKKPHPQCHFSVHSLFCQLSRRGCCSDTFIMWWIHSPQSIDWTKSIRKVKVWSPFFYTVKKVFDKWPLTWNKLLCVQGNRSASPTKHRERVEWVKKKVLLALFCKYFLLQRPPSLLRNSDNA